MMSENKLEIMASRIREAAVDYKDPLYNDIGKLNIVAAIGEMVVFNADLVADTLAPVQPAVPAPEASEPPAASAGVVPDVQCRCGYMASQHWADGSCPGDGYLGQGEPSTEDVTQTRDGNIFDMQLKDGETARAVWLPETEFNGSQLFIEQGHSAGLYRQIRDLQAELAASRERERLLAAAVEPFDAIWADWQAYCKETKKSKQLYKNITSWIQGTFPIENVATWIREAAAVVRKQATESGNR